MADKPKLTPKQRQVYDFIVKKIRARGYGPTVREIGAAFGINSPNGVMCHLQALVKKGLIQREANRSRAISIVEESRPQPGIPLAGAIAAGAPLETYEDVERVDFGEMFGHGDYYALKVRGESMIEDHIEDGDFVVVRKQQTAQEGQIVVALIDGCETTLKRFHKDSDRFRLEPANSTMEPIYCNDLEILGVVVGVVRRFEYAGF